MVIDSSALVQVALLTLAVSLDLLVTCLLLGWALAEQLRLRVACLCAGRTALGAVVFACLGFVLSLPVTGVWQELLSVAMLVAVGIVVVVALRSALPRLQHVGRSSFLHGDLQTLLGFMVSVDVLLVGGLAATQGWPLLALLPMLATTSFGLACLALFLGRYVRMRSRTTWSHG